MTVVLDASAALVWLLNEPEPEVSAMVRDLVRDGLAVVPDLWFSEIANALLMAERRGRLAPDARRRLAVSVDRLPIERLPLIGGIAALSELAAVSGLTAYDASYLQLALTHGLQICTTDSRLVAAARARDVGRYLEH